MHYILWNESCIALNNICHILIISSSDEMTPFHKLYVYFLVLKSEDNANAISKPEVQFRLGLALSFHDILHTFISVSRRNTLATFSSELYVSVCF